MPSNLAWTVDDLDRLPDDGLHYELLDGFLSRTSLQPDLLVVKRSPSSPPSWWHHRVEFR